MRSVQATFETYVKLTRRCSREVLMSVQAMRRRLALADTIIATCPREAADRPGAPRDGERPEPPRAAHEIMQSEIEILQVEKRRSAPGSSARWSAPQKEY